jgi:hypothetical protein
MVGKYTNLETNVFSIFASNTWKSEKITTYPNNFTVTKNSGEFIRVTIIPSGKGINLISTSGILIIDIFTLAGEGTRRSSLIADRLDNYMVGKSITNLDGSNTQMSNSSLSFIGVDTDNPALYRSNYTIPFNFYGAL